MSTIYLLGPGPAMFPCGPQPTRWVPLRADFEIGPRWEEFQDVKTFVREILGEPIGPVLDHMLDVYNADHRNRMIAMGRQLGKINLVQRYMEDVFLRG